MFGRSLVLHAQSLQYICEGAANSAPWHTYAIRTLSQLVVSVASTSGRSVDVVVVGGGHAGAYVTGHISPHPALHLHGLTQRRQPDSQHHFESCDRLKEPNGTGAVQAVRPQQQLRGEGRPHYLSPLPRQPASAL